MVVATNLARRRRPGWPRARAAPRLSSLETNEVEVVHSITLRKILGRKRRCLRWNPSDACSTTPSIHHALSTSFSWMTRWWTSSWKRMTMAKELLLRNVLVVAKITSRNNFYSGNQQPMRRMPRVAQGISSNRRTLVMLARKSKSKWRWAFLQPKRPRKPSEFVSKDHISQNLGLPNTSFIASN